ncbi:unnamed protein product [Effrenium voratum]|nr:unnamed protein product [Effrenium voratum]
MAEVPPVPEGYEMRDLCREDFHKGLIPLLAQLTQVDDLSESRFLEIFELRQRQAEVYRSLVIEHCESKQLVATASLIVEAKFVHGGACVGHVEDVVVDDHHRGKGLAKSLMNELAEDARRRRCYKVILDCKESNVGLYEKCGYKVCDRQMRLDIPASAAKP